jgi:peptide/nickel transport system substrate-binding protein
MGGSGMAGLSTAHAASLAQSTGNAKVVRMNTTTAVGTHFNPIWFIGTGSQWHSFPFIWLPLVFYDANGQMQPWLAESIDVSPDATTFTFTIAAGAQWSDGTPITATDVKFSYELVTNPLGASIGAGTTYNLSSISGFSAFASGEADHIAGIEIIDDRTVQFTLDAPNALFIFDCFVFVMPSHVLAGTAIEDLPSHPYVTDPTVTSGPFRLANYQPQQFIELEAWPEYWGEKKPMIDRLVLVQADGPSVVNSLESGELDLGVYITTEDGARLERSERLAMIFTESSGLDSIYVNGRRDYLSDPRIRQAFAYAIDRNILNELEHSGRAVLINSEIIGPEWAVSPNLNTYEFNPDTARQLLGEAGWDFGRTLVFWTSTSPDPLALYVQDALATIGVKVEIKTEAFSATADAYNADSFDLSSTGGGLMALDPDFASQRIVCGNTWSDWNNYCNEELDALFAKGVATTDQSERQEYYWQAGEIINHDLPFLYLYRPPTAYAVSNRLTGFAPPISFRFANASLLDWDLAE